MSSVREGSLEMTVLLAVAPAHPRTRAPAHLAVELDGRRS
jgi:hypothetical protein